MKSHRLPSFLALVACLPGLADALKPDPCAHFFRALKAVPHEKLTRVDGVYESLRDGKKRRGCEVTFATNETLLSGVERAPRFDAEKGTDLYHGGWRRSHSYDADGAGTSVHGIERGKHLCLISWAQPTSLEEPYVGGQGTLVRSETLTITVQCGAK